jgi:hypothetical protein
MNGIKDAMAGQRRNDNPRARLEPATAAAAKRIITTDSITTV